MCYYTLSHIWTFVTPWPPWRRWSPAEIAARWRYRPPIKNMRAHYNSQFCVNFHCVLLQEAQKRLWTCLNGAKHNLVHFKSLLVCLLIKSWSSSQHLHAGKKWRVIQSLPSHLVLISRPGQSQGCSTNTFLIHSLIHSVMVCENIFMAPPRPNGWRWGFQS